MIYLEDKLCKIEPVYDGNKPIAFRVVDKRTGEVSAQYLHLWEAEQSVGKLFSTTPSYR